MKCYLMYDQLTIWKTTNFENKDSGYSITYNDINEMVTEFRKDFDDHQYDDCEYFYEQCNNGSGNYYQEYTHDEVRNYI